MPELLFVYGTLRSGSKNPYARMLHTKGRLRGSATVRGSVIDLGAYPGFQPASAGEVQGELWELPSEGGLLAALDEYEGVQYQRVLVETTSGDRVWIYQLR